MNLLQYLEDEEKKLSDWISSLFAGLKSHPAVQASAAAEPEAVPGPVPPPGVEEPVQHAPGPAAAPVPVELPPGGNTTDPTAPGFHAPVETPAPAPAPEPPRVDTSADTLDYNVVRDVGINLTGAKTIVNCPASVVVKVNLQSGESGAHDSYTVTVNGVPSFQASSQAEWMSNNVGMQISGPTVTVSVDSPGLQMEIE